MFLLSLFYCFLDKNTADRSIKALQSFLRTKQKNIQLLRRWPTEELYLVWLQYSLYHWYSYKLSKIVFAPFLDSITLQKGHLILCYTQCKQNGRAELQYFNSIFSYFCHFKVKKFNLLLLFPNSFTCHHWRFHHLTHPPARTLCQLTHNKWIMLCMDNLDLRRNPVRL